MNQRIRYGEGLRDKTSPHNSVPVTPERLWRYLSTLRELDLLWAQLCIRERANSDGSELAAFVNLQGGEPLAALEGMVAYLRECRWEFYFLQIAVPENSAVVVVAAPEQSQPVI